MIKYEEFCKKFCEVESRYKLFDLEFNGIKYWKYARYYVYRVVIEKLFGISAPFWLDNENQWKLSKYTHKYQKITDAIFHNIDLSFQKDILLFTFSRRVKVGEKYISPVTDEIALNLEKSHCIVETPYCGGYYRPTPIRGIKYFDVWDEVGKEHRIYTPINRGQLRKQLLYIFEREFDITFTTEEKRILLININYFIMHRSELVTNYKRVISKINPKLVLYTSAYIGSWVVLTETLKEMGIPSVEILHGYVDDNYIPYNYSQIGLNDALPDYIFAHSQIQKDLIKWGIQKENIRVVGHPEAEKRSKQLLEQSPKREKKVITFISGASHSMEKYINELVENINAEEYEIIFKLHPTELGSWKNNYKNLSKRVSVIDNNEMDIHYYLANTDIVIGIYSTALIEATLYPVDIFILKEDGYQGLEFLLKKKRAILVSDSKELFSYIASGRSCCEQVENCFFKRDAIQNINSEIEQIIKESESK